MKTKNVLLPKIFKLTQKKMVKKLNIQGDMTSPKFIENILVG